MLEAIFKVLGCLADESVLNAQCLGPSIFTNEAQFHYRVIDVPIEDINACSTFRWMMQTTHIKFGCQYRNLGADESIFDKNSVVRVLQSIYSGRRCRLS